MAVRIEGSVALVSGANRGIGRALVDALLRRGAARVYAGARQVDGLSDLAAAHAARLLPLQLDVTNEATVREAAERATDVNLLINNAGIATVTPLHHLDALDGIRREFEVNVLGVLRMTQAFADILKRNGGGGVVNLASVGSLVNFPLAPTYSASKAAVHSLTQAARIALGGGGTLVMAAYPGPVDTDMGKALPFEKAAPTDVANAILDGVEAGAEEIFTDPMSRQLGELFLRDPKELERQVAAMGAA